MLEVQKVSVARRGRRLVDGVSFTAKRGEFWAILGPNGAGKTTLLRALSGEERGAGGVVRISERQLQDWPAADLARVRAVLPQESQLRFPFRVWEVVMMGRLPHLKGRERPVDFEIARRALESVGLGAFAERNYLTLSGGEKQRVHFARALAQLWESVPEKENYLLLDEPVSALDPAHQHAILDLARGLARRGDVILATLHDLNLAAYYASHWLIMKDGKAVAHGPVQEVLSSALIEEVFGVRAEIRYGDDNKPLIVTRSGGASVLCWATENA